MRLRILSPNVDRAAYEAELELRYLVLRKPLGMTRSQVTVPGEEGWTHVVAVDGPEGDEVVGCALYGRESQAVGRLRQMAVTPDRQHAGIGRLLVGEIETLARRDGLLLVSMHARQAAVGFYEKLGYLAVGEPFVEVGIPHRCMEKSMR